MSSPGRFLDKKQTGDYISSMATHTAPCTVVPQEFPELAQLVWNRDPARPIPAAEAFALYERNWRHVDAGHLTRKEADLIHALTDEYGNGVFLS